jgi:hypothetical protein
MGLRSRLACVRPSVVGPAGAGGAGLIFIEIEEEMQGQPSKKHSFHGFSRLGVLEDVSQRD